VAAVIHRPVIAALARACTPDIERARQALKGAVRPRIHVFLATSDIHLKYKLRLTREQCLEQARSSVQLAKSLCDDIEFSPEDATRTDPEFLCAVVQAVVDAGATTVNIPDTVGYTVPSEYAQTIRMLRERVRGIEKATISVHCHNDLGLAVANSLAAIEAGARQVECTINGIGERAGNASLEELVMAMRVRADRYAFDTGVVSEQLYPASHSLTEITEVPVQPNKAIIGRNAFAHEAGIHQDGVLKNPLTYEIMTPHSVGVPDSRLVLGKHSGRHALSLRCEQLGYRFERRELDEVYRRFVVLADRIKHVEDQHLLELIHQVQGEVPRIPPAHVQATAIAAAAAGSNGTHGVDRAFIPQPALELPLSAAPEHHNDQEDYLWGV
jgi:2-isopropylmalate synthase